MSYTKTDWINGQTPINATNLNKIEDQLETNTNDISTNAGNIQQNTTDISGLDSSLTTLSGTVNTINNGLGATNLRIGNLGQIDLSFYPSSNLDLVNCLNAVPTRIRPAYTAPNVADYQGVFNLQGFIIEWGTVTVDNVPATSYSTTQKTFNSTFSKIPAVFIQPQGNQNVIGQVAGLSTTGFTLNARSGDGNARTDRIYTYIAIGV